MICFFAPFLSCLICFFRGSTRTPIGPGLHSQGFFIHIHAKPSFLLFWECIPSATLTLATLMTRIQSSTYLPTYLSVHSYIHYTQIKSKDHSYHLHDPQNSYSSCRLFSYNPPSSPLRCYCLLLLQLPALRLQSTEALCTLWGRTRE